MKGTVRIQPISTIILAPIDAQSQCLVDYNSHPQIRTLPANKDNGLFVRGFSDTYTGPMILWLEQKETPYGKSA